MQHFQGINGVDDSKIFSFAARHLAVDLKLAVAIAFGAYSYDTLKFKKQSISAFFYDKDNRLRYFTSGGRGRTHLF